jgi:hypothetical protein
MVSCQTIEFLALPWNRIATLYCFRGTISQPFIGPMIPYSIAVMHFLLLPLSCASLVYRTSTGREVTIPVYSDLMAPAHFEMHNLTVVDLTRDVGVFDYCDLSKYNPLDIQPLLRAHGITGDKNNANNTKWIAYYKDLVVKGRCSQSRDDWRLSESVYYAWPSLFVYHIQRIGAVGVLYKVDVPTLSRYLLPPYARYDNEGGYFVNGTLIKVFAAYMISRDESEIEGFQEQVLDASRSQKDPAVTIFSISNDENHLDAAVSLLHILRPVLLVWATFVLGYSVFVARKYYVVNMNSFPLRYSGLSIIITMGVSLARIAKFIDALGVSFSFLSSIISSQKYHRRL